MTEVSDLYERSAVTLSIVVSPVNIWTSSVNTRMKKKTTLPEVSSSLEWTIFWQQETRLPSASRSGLIFIRIDHHRRTPHRRGQEGRIIHTGFCLATHLPTQLQLVTAPPAHRPKLPANDSKFFRSEIATPSIHPLAVYLSHSQSWSGAGVFVCSRRNDVLRKLRLALKAWKLALDIL